MKEKRSRLNIVLLTLYVIWYMLLPAGFLIAIHGDIEMPSGLVWTSYFAGFGILFYVIGGFALTIESYPHSNRKAFMLFVPVIVNHLLYLALYGTDFLLRIMTTNAAITFGAFILSVFLSAIFQPWYNEEDYENSGISLHINSWKSKINYIKKDPYILVAFGILLLPVFSIVYYTVGGGLILVTDPSSQPIWSDIALYVFSYINITVFNYQDIKKNFAQ